MTLTKEQLTGIIESAEDVLQALAGTHEDIHPESKKMIEAWDHLNDRAAPPEVVKRLAENALASLTAEPIYQCEFCHHGGNGELQWHWEDVNKAFYDQYDSERRGKRRILYAPPPAPVELDATDRTELVAYRWKEERLEAMLRPDCPGFEAACRALWDVEPHTMLANAGFAVDYDSQPPTIKARIKRKVLAVMRTAAREVRGEG